MISDKSRIILAHRICATGTNSNLVFVTAIGLIKGRLDEETLKSYAETPQPELYDPLDEPIEFIPLKNATITDLMGNTIAINALTIYTDQVIASYIEQ